ncbi:hypothetical protein GCM10022277_07390 [Litoribacillus peritrichatus]|uniref:Uncharacterized protein n=1 Tax=Litoribacillus peritrichatus TaxID=718191 RepID=A0ABP7M700_9GAMM
MFHIGLSHTLSGCFVPDHWNSLGTFSDGLGQPTTGRDVEIGCTGIECIEISVQPELITGESLINSKSHQ